MELRQLKSLIALVENGYNVSQAANRMNLVQSAVSQQISKLESELNTQIFVRHGKRLIGLTDIGQEILDYAYRTLANVENIREISREQLKQGEGMLRIGATHTQARYILPSVIKQFRAHYPDIELQVHQGTPEQLVEKAIHDDVDFSICTEALATHADLLTIPCYRWNRGLIALADNPILQHDEIDLELLTHYPIVTYVYGFTGRSVFTETFTKEGLKPKVVLSAADTDIIKTYVREGLGVGIIASLAYVNEQDEDLVERDLSALFPWETTRIAYQKDKYIRRHQQYFIDLFQQTVRQQGRWHGLEAVESH
ncbi:LysR substrate-binding domain-containing protein [Leucothrix pacifica]|uniref:Transcriptional regulator CysB n=1 Tax=Leucothrix pacifica TaxID=1247513 RepID=A0A317CF92_9GAMM|nr:LysR substrate-binding domain-containing protein [Leucothrix pacifica]PWQ96073.1 transcriptional regulator CysB [Leucothrix pacifica]